MSRQCQPFFNVNKTCFYHQEKVTPPPKKTANRNGIPDEEGGLVSDGTELWDGTSVITKPQLTEVNLIAPNKSQNSKQKPSSAHKNTNKHTPKQPLPPLKPQ